MKPNWFFLIPYSTLALSIFLLEFAFARPYMIWFSVLNPLLLAAVWIIHHNIMRPVLPRNLNSKKEIDYVLNQIDHEINTPITTLGACLENLMDEIPSNHHLNSMQESLNRLKDINSHYIQLLCLKTRSEVDALPFDLAEELRLCMIECMELLDYKRMQYVVRIPEKPVPVFGHQKLIREALKHLMTHAVNNPEVTTQFHISLNVHYNFAAITLEHHGQAPNLKRDLMAQQVFNLQNAPLQNQPLGTLGLALTLSKAIIEQHNGLIDYQYCGAKTTRYHVTLPIMS